MPPRPVHGCSRKDEAQDERRRCIELIDEACRARQAAVIAAKRSHKSK